MLLMPRIKMPAERVFMVYRWGLSHGGDYDNFIKPFQDILQEKYNFDDRNIIGALAWKCKAKRGQEFIQFDIYPWNLKIIPCILRALADNLTDSKQATTV